MKNETDSNGPYLGINLWNWERGLGAGCLGLPEKVKELGYSSIEIPMTEDKTKAVFSDEIRASGLYVTQCASLPKGMDLSSFETEEQTRAMHRLTENLKCGEQMGSHLLCGALYTGGGKCHYLDENARKREWDYAVKNLRKLSKIAAECGIYLALEPLNHFRTSVCNTSGQVLQMVKDIGESNVGLHYDLFHASIEELDLYGSLEMALQSGKLYHLHAAANNRGVPGQGILPWEDIFSLLGKYSYQKCITIESFVYGGLDSSYYRVFGSPDEQASIGIVNMKNYMKQYNAEVKHAAENVSGT